MKFRKNTESKNPNITRTKKGRIVLLSVRDNKKSKFIKEKKASGLSSSLEIKTPLSRINFVGPLLLSMYYNKRYKMNNIVNKFLLAGDKLMPEIHLKQPGFTNNACGHFTKNKEKT